MGERMWNVEFESNLGYWSSDKYHTVTVLAPNIKKAVLKARIIKKKDKYCKLHDITEVKLVGECNG